MPTRGSHGSKQFVNSDGQQPVRRPTTKFFLPPCDVISVFGYYGFSSVLFIIVCVLLFNMGNLSEPQSKLSVHS